MTKYFRDSSSSVQSVLDSVSESLQSPDPSVHTFILHISSAGFGYETTQNVHISVFAKDAGMAGFKKKTSVDGGRGEGLVIIPFSVTLGLDGRFWLQSWLAWLWERGSMAGCLLGMVIRGRWKSAPSWAWAFSACLLNFLARRMLGSPRLSLWAFCCHTSYLENLTLRGFFGPSL